MIYDIVMFFVDNGSSSGWHKVRRDGRRGWRGVGHLRHRQGRRRHGEAYAHGAAETGESGHSSFIRVRYLSAGWCDECTCVDDERDPTASAPCNLRMDQVRASSQRAERRSWKSTAGSTKS
jgi:hypothetical protein